VANEKSENQDSKVVSIDTVRKLAPELSTSDFWKNHPDLFEEYVKAQTATQLEARRALSPKLYKRLAKLLVTSKVKEIDEKLITEKPFWRIKGRDHNGKESSNLNLDLKEQVFHSEGVLNPLIVLKDLGNDNTFCIISGKRRLEALRDSGKKTVPCKVIDPNILLRHFRGLLQESFIWLLAEACQNIVYSESIHNTVLSDEQIIEFFRLIRRNYDYKRENFREVMKLIGLHRKSPKYNSLRRLWFIACNPFMVKLVDEQLVPTRVLKKEEVSNVFYFNEELSHRIVNRIQTHVKDLEPKIKEKDRDQPKYKWSNYEITDVIRLILEIDQPGSSDISRYRNPRVKTRVIETRLYIPSITLDFGASDENNLRNIVEALYKFEYVANEIRSFVKGRGPDSIGGKFQPSRPIPNDVKYGQEYIDFIRQMKLERYINLPKVVKYFEEKDPARPLLTKDDKNNIFRDERNSKAIDNFIEFSKIEDENEKNKNEELDKKLRQATSEENSFRRDYLKLLREKDAS